MCMWLSVAVFEIEEEVAAKHAAWLVRKAITIFVCHLIILVKKAH